MITGIDEVIKQASSYLPEADLQLITRAYELANKAHEGQIRKSGVPYIMHPIAVAGILAGLHMDAVTIAAGFLHDVVEDTDISIDDVRNQFGAEVALLVDGVTKLDKIKYKSKEEQLAENHRKMLVAMAQDIRVIMIKLADRLHNMRTLRHMSEEKQREISDETMEIFAPLAHRLGIASVKWELEDTSLRYLNPQQYYRIVNLMQKKRVEREAYINEAEDMIQEKLKELHIEAEISGRPKHIYSIYKKMTTQNKQFNEIYDLLALRIIVNDIRDCYAVLGIVHTLWKPMPGRFKDYIAMPKPNMYQSLHTTVIGPKGEPLEVQIRTWEMHQTAEIGIAAHWAYKEGKGIVQGSFAERIGSLREIIQGGHEESPNAQEFMESLKQDLFSDTVFVFTPKGDVVELPKGSVPLDFAYRIHSAVGNRCIGAKINGKIVPLDYGLKTGDIIEVLTSKHSYGPSQDWLKIAKSAHARNKIKQWFKKEKREENVAKGQQMVELEIKSRGFDLKEVLTDEKIQEAAAKFNFQAQDEMYAAVGYGGLTAAQVVTRLTEKLRREREEQTIPEFKPSTSSQGTRSESGIKVKGIDNLLVRISRCCTPVPGDPIIGFVTRGRGVSVHRKDCPNVLTEEFSERLIDVEWESDLKHNYSVDIEITGHDRNGLLNDVLQVVSETKTNISAVSGKADKNRVATIHMTISISNLDHLQKVVERIKRIKDIYSVRRILST